jgi:hypothetical protein
MQASTEASVTVVRPDSTPPRMTSGMPIAASALAPVDRTRDRRTRSLPANPRFQEMIPLTSSIPPPIIRPGTMPAANSPRIEMSRSAAA